MDRRKAVFLDLNGTLVTPVEVERLTELKLIEGVVEAVARLCRAGFVCPVVTIQSRIEKGVFSENEFHDWFRLFAAAMAARGADLKGPYVCPHRFSNPCACAKPLTALYEQAAADLGISLPASFTIGDTAADVEAGCHFGGRGCLVLTGYAARQPVDATARARQLASYTGRTLGEVVDWILQQPAA